MIDGEEVDCANKTSNNNNTKSQLSGTLTTSSSDVELNNCDTVDDAFKPGDTDTCVVSEQTQIESEPLEEALSNTEDVPSPEPDQEEEDIDEFGDFADFVVSSSADTHEAQWNTDDSNSDWANFDTNLSLAPATDDTCDDGWSIKREESTTLSCEKNRVAADATINEEDFAESFDQTMQFNADKRLSSNQTETEEIANIRLRTLLAVFLEKSESLKDCNETKCNPRLYPTDHDASFLWSCLESIEESLALKFQWAQSSVQKLFYDSVDVNPSLASLRNPDLPAFASQLGMVLTPDKTSSPKLQPNKASTPADVSAQCSRREVDGCGNAPATSLDSLAVPPAEFDWGSSGLTNPLTRGGCALLDLDFFQLTENSPASETALQKDLKMLGLEDIQKFADSQGTSQYLNGSLKSNPSAHLPNDAQVKHSNIAQSIAPSSGAVILEGLLSAAKTSQSMNVKSAYNGGSVSSGYLSKMALSAHEQTATEPSEAAKKCLERIPDLSFMLKSVLMFPVRGDCENDDK